MKSFSILGAALFGLFAPVAIAAAIPAELAELAPFTPIRDSLEERQSPASCVNVGNTATTRHCWAPGFTSSTDMYTSWPNTGVIRSYNLRIENTTCNPDGAGSRVCMLINGRYPGPTIIANWGDTIRVTVRNLLQANGTSIHWHGFRRTVSMESPSVHWHLTTLRLMSSKRLSTARHGIIPISRISMVTESLEQLS
jgi:FtsP/CotA-like multicopper oxidase with cupredoxin domain